MNLFITIFACVGLACTGQAIALGIVYMVTKIQNYRKMKKEAKYE